MTYKHPNTLSFSDLIIFNHRPNTEINLIYKLHLFRKYCKPNFVVIVQQTAFLFFFRELKEEFFVIFLFRLSARQTSLIQCQVKDLTK